MIMDTVKVLWERVYKAGFILRKELVETGAGGDDHLLEMVHAYNPNDDYIGDAKTAHFLCQKLGIQPQLMLPDHQVCSIGFSVKDGKWYGWSHRAVYGFKKGSTCSKGDCHYSPANEDEFLDGQIAWYTNTWHEDVRAVFSSRDEQQGVTVSWVYAQAVPNAKLRKQPELLFKAFPSVWGRGEWTAESIGDARIMACAFAEGVS